MFSKRDFFKFTQSKSYVSGIDLVAHEENILITVNKSPFVTLRASRSDLRELAIGHLLTCGVIKRYDDIKHIETADDYVVNVELKTKPSLQEKSDFKYIDANWAINAKIIFDGMRLLEDAPFYRKTGAFHGAILMHNSGHQYFLLEDISRHNVVEKAIGKALEKRVKMEECLMLISGRLMCELVSKILIAKIPILGSVSATTCEAIEMAQKYGVTLIGFIREGRMNVYTHPARITDFFLG